jgi:hypothetical protein
VQRKLRARYPVPASQLRQHIPNFRECNRPSTTLLTDPAKRIEDSGHVHASPLPGRP